MSDEPARSPIRLGPGQILGYTRVQWQRMKLTGKIDPPCVFEKVEGGPRSGHRRLCPGSHGSHGWLTFPRMNYTIDEEHPICPDCALVLRMRQLDEERRETGKAAKVS